MVQLNVLGDKFNDHTSNYSSLDKKKICNLFRHQGTLCKINRYNKNGS